jgi:uncharacterized repeat protein (TIGR02543 family)
MKKISILLLCAMYACANVGLAQNVTQSIGSVQESVNPWVPTTPTPTPQVPTALPNAPFPLLPPNATSTTITSDVTINTENFSTTGYIVDSSVRIVLNNVGQKQLTGSFLKIKQGKKVTLEIRGNNSLTIASTDNNYLAGIELPVEADTLFITGNEDGRFTIAVPANTRGAAIGGSGGRNSGANGAKGKNGTSAAEYPTTGGNGQNGDAGQDAGIVVIRGPQVTVFGRIGGGDGAPGGIGGRGGHGSVGNDGCSLACHSGASGGNGGDGGHGGNGGALRLEGGVLKVYGDIRGGNGGIGGRAGEGGTKTCVNAVTAESMQWLAFAIKQAISIAGSIGSFLPPAGPVVSGLLSLGMGAAEMGAAAGGKDIWAWGETIIKHGGGGNGGNSAGGVVPSVYFMNGKATIYGNIMQGNGIPGEKAVAKRYDYDFNSGCTSGTGYDWPGDHTSAGENGKEVEKSDSLFYTRYAGQIIVATPNVTINGNSYTVVKKAFCDIEYSSNLPVSKGGEWLFDPGNCPNNTIRITMNNMGLVNSMTRGITIDKAVTKVDLIIRGKNKMELIDPRNTGLVIQGQNNTLLSIYGDDTDTLEISNPGGIAIGGMNETSVANSHHAGIIYMYGGTIIANRVGGAQGKTGASGNSIDNAEFLPQDVNGHDGSEGGRGGNGGILAVYGGKLISEFIGGGTGGTGGAGGDLLDIKAFVNNNAGNGGRGGQGGNGTKIFLLGGTIIADTLSGGYGGVGGYGGIIDAFIEYDGKRISGIWKDIVSASTGDGGNGGNGGTGSNVIVIDGSIEVKQMLGAKGGDGGNGLLGMDAAHTDVAHSEERTFRAADGGHGGHGGRGGHPGALNVYGGAIVRVDSITPGIGGHGGNGGDGGSRLIIPERLKKDVADGTMGIVNSTISMVGAIKAGQAAIAADAAKNAAAAADAAYHNAMLMENVTSVSVNEAMDAANEAARIAAEAANKASTLTKVAVGAGYVMAVVGVGLSLAAFGMTASAAHDNIQNLGKDGHGGNGGNGGNGGGAPILNIQGGNVILGVVSNVGMPGYGGGYGSSNAGKGDYRSNDYGVRHPDPGVAGSIGNMTTDTVCYGANAHSSCFVINGGSVTIESYPYNMPPVDDSAKLVYLNTFVLNGAGNLPVLGGSVDSQPFSIHKMIVPKGYGITDVKTTPSGALYFWLPPTTESEEVVIDLGSCNTYTAAYIRPEQAIQPVMVWEKAGVTLTFQQGEGRQEPTPASYQAQCSEPIELPVYNACAAGYHHFWRAYRNSLQRVYYWGIDERGELAYYNYDYWVSKPILYRGGQSVSFETNDTLRAVCAPDSSTIFFDANRGYRPSAYIGGVLQEPKDTLTAVYNQFMPTIPSRYDDNARLLQIIPVRYGYSFSGYYDTVSRMYYNAAGAPVALWDKAANRAPDDLTTKSPYGEYTLYARWNPDTTIVYFDRNDDCIQPPACGTGWILYNQWQNERILYSKKAAFDQPLPDILPLPTKVGYRLTGIYASPTSTEKYYNADGSAALPRWYLAVAQDTLYAGWEQIRYNVVYNTNMGGTPAGQGGVSDSMPAAHENVLYDESITIRNYTGNRVGYIFNGWTLTQNSSVVTHNAGTQFRRMSAVNGDTIVLYAVWKPVYTILNFENQTIQGAYVSGGRTAQIAAHYSYDMPNLLSFSAPTSSGVNFAGYWDENAPLNSTSGNMYYDASGLSARTWDRVDSVFTLYARWSDISYNVQYVVTLADVQGQINPTNHTNVRYGSAITLATYSGSRTGYDFAGWSTIPNSSSVEYPAGSRASNLTNVNGATVTLYSVWEQNETCIDFGHGCIIICDGPHCQQSARVNLSSSMSLASPAPSASISASSTSQAASTSVDAQAHFTIKYGADMLDYADKFPPLQKTGYTFGGYYTGDGLKIFDSVGVPAFSYWMDTAKYVLITTKWIPNKYSITYEALGGSPAAPTGHSGVEYDAAIELQPYTGQKYGYNFIGWSADTNGMSSLLTDSAKNLSPNDGAIVQLYAVWEPTTTAISFDANGGLSGQATILTARYNETLPAIDANSAPTRRGYIFAGYGDGSNLYYNASGARLRVWDKEDAQYTLYAQWQVGAYSINYDIQGGSGSIPAAQPNVAYDVDIALRTYNGTKLGYIFDGWALAAGAREMVYSAGGSVQGLGAAGSMVTLYAAWKPKESVIIYNANGGEFPVPIPTIKAKYGMAMPSFGVFPAKTGHDFAGFYTQSANGIQYYDEFGTSMRSWDKLDETMELYAHWQPKTTNLRYNANGGVGAPMGISVVRYGDELPALGDLPSRIGYTFSGFYDNSVGGEMYYDSIGQRQRIWNSTSKQAVLFAQWKAKSTIISFDVNGGTWHTEPAPRVALFDSELEILPDDEIPSRRHYRFAGYYDAPQYGTAYYGIVGIPLRTWNHDVPAKTLYAQWRGNEYVINYKNYPMGIVANLPDAYNVGIGVEFENPRHPQYEFGGFYLDSTFSGTPITGMTAQDTGSKVVYTKWTYSVEYDKNGGTGTAMPSVMHEYMANNVILPVPIDWTRYGYEPCLGWSVNPDAIEAQFPREGASAAALAANKRLRLYAVWQPKRTKVKLLANATTTTSGGISAQTPEVTASYGLAMPDLPDGVPTRLGYVFAGYYDMPQGGTQYYDANGHSSQTWDKIDDEAQLYAHWEGSQNNFLTGLQISSGRLVPSFVPNIHDYTLLLPCSEDVQMLLNYTSGTMVKINNQPVQNTYMISASPSFAVLQIEGSASGEAAAAYTIKLNVPLPNSNIIYNPDISPRLMEVSENVLSAATYENYRWYEDGTALTDIEGMVLFRPSGFRAGAVYSVTAFANSGDSIRICGKAAQADNGNTDRGLEAFPNPAVTNVILSHPDFGKENTIVRIFTTVGSLVITQPVEAGSGTSVTVDISGLASGMYVVKALGATTTIVKQ